MGQLPLIIVHASHTKTESGIVESDRIIDAVARVLDRRLDRYAPVIVSSPGGIRDTVAQLEENYNLALYWEGTIDPRLTPYIRDAVNLWCILPDPNITETLSPGRDYHLVAPFKRVANQTLPVIVGMLEYNGVHVDKPLTYTYFPLARLHLTDQELRHRAAYPPADVPAGNKNTPCAWYGTPARLHAAYMADQLNVGGIDVYTTVNPGVFYPYVDTERYGLHADRIGRHVLTPARGAAPWQYYAQYKTVMHICHPAAGILGWEYPNLVHYALAGTPIEFGGPDTPEADLDAAQVRRAVCGRSKRPSINALVRYWHGTKYPQFDLQLHER